MNRTTAVVTGGAGFIGSHMVDLLLARGYQVRVIDNLAGGREANLAHHSNESRLSFEQMDIRRLSPGEPSFQDVELVFHFAGIGDIERQVRRLGTTAPPDLIAGCPSAQRR